MGSFGWENPHYFHYHNGRPLSVALTEPFQTEISPFFENDFVLQQHQHYHPRCHSSGRRHQRDYYSIYHPNAEYSSYYYSPQVPRRSIYRSTSGDVLIEKFQTVTLEEQCQPTQNVISYVYAPSPPVRQVKIRPRPSSCVDLQKSATTDNRWTKVVDERHEEHYQYHYNHPSERIVPIRREPTPPPRIIRYDATTATDDLYIPIKEKPARPSTRDAGTTTAGLPRRPLSVSETQVIERYEQDEKVIRDTKTELGIGGISTQTTTLRPLHYYDDDDDESTDRQYHQTSKKTQRKDFFQRMHARNGTTFKPQNILNVYSDYGRNQTIIRPTCRPREALVDTFSIVSPPEQLIETKTTTTSTTRSAANFENNSSSRDYFYSS